MAHFWVVGHKMFSGVQGQLLLKEQVVLIPYPAYLYQEKGKISAVIYL